MKMYLNQIFENQVAKLQLSVLKVNTLVNLNLYLYLNTKTSTFVPIKKQIMKIE